MNKKVPDIVKKICKGYAVQYRGEYKGNDVFSIGFKRNSKSLDIEPSFTGFPAYILVSKDGHETVKQVSDRDFAITAAVMPRQKAKKQLDR